MLPKAKPESVGLSSKRLQVLSDTFKREIDKGTLPGAVLMVARKGKVAHFDAVGRQHPAHDAPMRHDSVFRIFSMTKPIVSMAIMQLVEQGRILLADPLSKYIPAFAQTRVGVAFLVAEGSEKRRNRAAVRDSTTPLWLAHTGVLGLGSAWGGAKKTSSQLRASATDASVASRLGQSRALQSDGDGFLRVIAYQMTLWREKAISSLVVGLFRANSQAGSDFCEIFVAGGAA